MDAVDELVISPLPDDARIGQVFELGLDTAAVAGGAATIFASSAWGLLATPAAVYYLDQKASRIDLPGSKYWFDFALCVPCGMMNVTVDKAVDTHVKELDKNYNEKAQQLIQYQQEKINDLQQQYDRIKDDPAKTDEAKKTQERLERLKKLHADYRRTHPDPN